MADEKIVIQTEVDVVPSIAELKRLQKELKTTTDPAEFKRLQQQIDDTKESIAAARAGAGNFAEVLGGLPGPIGEIGNRVGGLVGTLKQFGQVKLTDVKGSFTELGKDIVDAGKGLLQLTGITKAYAVTNNFLANSFKAVGASEAVAAAGARGFAAALTATGIGALVVLLGTLVANFDKVGEALMRMIPGLKEVGKWIGDLYDKFTDFLGLTSQDERNLEKQIKTTNRRKEDLQNRVKILEAEGGKEKEVYKLKKQIQEETINDLKQTLKVKGTLTDEESKLYRDARAEQLALDAAEGKRLKDVAKTAESAQQQKKDKTKAAINQDLETLKKGRLDARLELLEDQKKEEAVVKKKYDDLIALAIKNKQDTTDFEKAKKKELQDITDKYDKIALDNQKKKEEEAKQLRAEEFEKEKARLALQKAQGLIDEDTYQSNLKKLREQYATGEVDSINAQIDYLNYLQTEKDKALEKDKERAAKQLEYNKQVRQSWIDLGDNIAGTFRQLAGIFEEGSDLAKAFAITSVVVGAAVSIAKINESFAGQIADANKAISSNGSVVAQGLGLLGNPLTAPVGAAMIATGTKGGAVATALLARAKVSKALQIGTVVASSGAQIAAILSAKKGGSASAASSGGGGGATAPPPVYGGAPAAMATPQIQSGIGVNPTTQIASTLASATNKPVQAYVVSTQLSSQQALDRRTNVASTFN